MRNEIDHNEISMDTAEQGTLTPPETAIRTLADQLSLPHLDTAASAAVAIQKAALYSDDPSVRITAIRVLGSFISINPAAAGDRRSQLYDAQWKAQDNIAAIAFGSEQAEVRLEAVNALGKSLDVPVLHSDSHRNTIQLIAILGSTSPDNSLKNATINILAEYARRTNGNRGYSGSIAYPESQVYANAAIGVVSRPAAPANTSPVNP